MHSTVSKYSSGCTFRSNGPILYVYVIIKLYILRQNSFLTTFQDCRYHFYNYFFFCLRAYFEIYISKLSCWFECTYFAWRKTWYDAMYTSICPHKTWKIKQIKQTVVLCSQKQSNGESLALPSCENQDEWKSFVKINSISYFSAYGHGWHRK